MSKENVCFNALAFMKLEQIWWQKCRLAWNIIFFYAFIEILDCTLMGLQL